MDKYSLFDYFLKIREKINETNCCFLLKFIMINFQYLQFMKKLLSFPYCHNSSIGRAPLS